MAANTPLRTRALFTATALATPLLMASAWAQEGDADLNETVQTTEEIVVTARRREETAIDVPISVSSFSSDDLLRAGAQDITYLTQTVPNLVLEVSRGTNTTISAFIRGVGQQDPVAGFEQGVGLYLDDVYLNRPQAAILDVFDIERIEVLRGPQGTLYGRNTIGGAIKYVTRRLDNERATANLRVTGGTFRQLDVVGSFGLPVLKDSAIGDVQIGGAIGRFTRDGFGENLVIDGLENYNKDIFAARATLEWEIQDAFSLRVIGDWTDDDSDPRQGHRLLAADQVFNVGTAPPSIVTDPSTGLPFSFPVLDDVFDTRAGLNNPEQSVVARGVSITAEGFLNENITLRAIGAYRDDRTESPIDFDSTPVVDLDVPVVYDNEQYSAELQAIFEGYEFADGFFGLNGLIGAYYLSADAFNEFDVLLGTLSNPAGPPLNSFTLGDVETSTWSIFANFTLDIGRYFALELGGRYTSDTRDATIARQLLLGPSPTFGGVSPATVIGGGTPTPFDASETFTEFDPRVSLSFAPNDSMTFYVSYSEGFKSGGFDPRGSTTAAPDLNGDGVVDRNEQEAFLQFEPEEITTYEIGANTAFFNRRVNSRLAFFYSDYESVQIPGSIGVDQDGDGQADDFIGVTTNAAEATLWGVEFETNARVWNSVICDGDTLDYVGTFGYINAEFDELIGATGEDVSDQSVFQNTPEFTASSRITYSTPMQISEWRGDFSIFGEFSYQSEVSQFNFRGPLDQEGYALINAGASWTTESGFLSFQVNAQNLTDEEYIVAGYDFVTNNPAFANSPLGTTGVLTAFYGNPRTVLGSIIFSY